MHLHLEAGVSLDDHVTPPVDFVSSCEVVHELADLGAIFDERLNVVVLPHICAAAALAEAAELLRAPLPRVVLALSPDEVGRRALALDLPGLPALANELFFWVEALCELVGCAGAGVRLTRLDAAMCPAFHVDHVGVRLAMTLVGPGTEYLEERSGDAPIDRSPRGLSTLLEPAVRLHRASAGDVVLLKGGGWPGNEGRGAIHRSPPHGGVGPRLLLTLDPLG